MEHIVNEGQAREIFNSLDPSLVLEVSDRIVVLKKLLEIVIAHADDVVNALNKDLGRHPHETCLIELYPMISEIKYILSKIKKWAKPTWVMTPLLLTPSNIKVDKTPLGKGFIISPFNFPFFLSIPYVAMAIAAGNVVLIRPSLKTPTCSDVIGTIISELGQPNVARVISCEHEVADIITKLPWDKIFYTGSPKIGKHIMDLASDNLVPLTLELGGKSPVIITRHSDISLAAKRVAFGKTTNCGQICVAPDYLLIENSIESGALLDAFMKEYKYYMEKFFGTDPHDSISYSRMVSKDATKRIKDMIKEAEDAEKENKHGLNGKRTKVLMGSSGNVICEEKYVCPTVILNPAEDMQCMKEEIFGPVLPIIQLPSLDEIIKFVNKRPKPLALYAFTDSKEEMCTISKYTRSGDLLFNDLVLHAIADNVPFGGVGNSGMGVAHGYQAFLDWCSQRTIFSRNPHGGLQNVDNFMRYAPYEKCFTGVLGMLSCGWKYEPGTGLSKQETDTSETSEDIK